MANFLPTSLEEIKEDLNIYAKYNLGLSDSDFEGANISLLTQLLSYNTVELNRKMAFGFSEMFLNTAEDPIWLVQNGTMNTESYRIPETREDALDLTLYEKPAVLRPDAIAKIEITRTDEKRTFPEGWDPLTGYPNP